MGGDRGDWVEVRPRRRKVRRQAEENDHRQRDNSSFWFGRTRLHSPWQRHSPPVPLLNKQYACKSDAGVGQRVLTGSEAHKSNFADPGSETQRLEKINSQRADLVSLGSGLKRYVSFYFTNFPPLISYFNLRKGFEVCGILEDIYVASKRNVHGEVYGFVKFSNVKNVHKLTKALNEVCFGNYRVHSSLARFDRKDTADGRNIRKEKDEIKAAALEVTYSDHVKKGDNRVEGVQVGEVLVRLVDRKKLVGTTGAGEKGSQVLTGQPAKQFEKEVVPSASVFVRKYKPLTEDVQWAQDGMVATITNGEAIPVVQSRVADAGFSDLDIIPMGADKVLLRSLSAVDVATIVDGAKEFFNLIFSNRVRWNNEVVSAQRGAWVRLYGIPLHAWNENFFKLCVLDCRRYMRADNCTVEKVRLDYARILIATSALEAVNSAEKLLIDGELIEVKIIEEWGLALGDDACLFDNELDSETNYSDNEAALCDREASNNIDILVDKITTDVVAETGKGDQKILQKKGVGSQALVNHLDLANNPGKSTVISNHTGASGERPRHAAKVNQSKRTKSCPPGVDRSVGSGPWSLEWLHDHNHGDVGVIFSTKKRRKDAERSGLGQGKDVALAHKKRKDKGALRHYSIKKVSRLPREDRREVLRILNKNESRRRGTALDHRSYEVKNTCNSEEIPSLGSINNDWQNWVVMQGNDKAAVDDVWGIGQVIGVTPHSDNANRFSALGSQGVGEAEGGVQVSGGKETVHRASGGLLTMWDTSEVEVWSSTSREHVLWCHGRFLKTGEEFYLANVYAPCEMGAKQSLWNSLLGRIHLLNGERVCVCGDFNAVRSIEERRSSRAGSHSSDHIPFNQFIDDDVLIDLPLSGRKFTWYKGDGLAMSRLDRFLLSEEWCLTGPNCVQVAQLRGLSDHCPLVLEADEENWGPRPSRILKCWKDIPGYQQFVRDKWNAMQIDGWGGFVLKEKFKMIRLALKAWHAAHSQNLPGRIDSLKVRLSVLEVKGEEAILSEAKLEELHWLTSEIHSLSRRSATSQRRGNVVSSIQVDGVTTEGVQPIRQAVFEHFASHFKESDVARPGVDNLQFKRLTLLEGGSLTKPFSLEEVKTAVWDCDSFKSPGPDGINFGFIKDFWSEMQADVMRFIADFHRNWKLTKGLNSTFIALIPKVDSPQCLNDFRPISLVGSLYKILAKVLANRLRLVIGSVISESQTSFVKDRQILDGILIANEAVDEARKTKKELLLFKVDFEKAYDSVDWSYLDAVMGRMSFPVLWRKWKKECICTASASVLVNGSPTEEFPLQRGLRQGDPLSPFLFLLAAEGLNILMQAMVDRQFFSGYSFRTQNQISVSHLQFANDTHLREFNLALLGKWCWRMLVDRGGLWFRVLAARYGVERGCVREGGRNGSSWWREIVRIRDGVDGLGGRWFGEGVVRKVGDGTESYFWTDPWLGGTPLCVRFGRLFDLAVNKSSTVAEMCSLGWDTGGEACEWQRHLWAWEEEMLGECQVLLHDFILQAQLSDTWIWRLDPVSGYSVRGAYQLLTSHPSDPQDAVLDLIWHKQVPLKVSIFAWRLLRDRLPTKTNLAARGIITSEA
ncbi:hypothetical protein TSUD_247050 [Trifolium subterraneum]|uniref:Reverse transcriptase domain-containing protein n=1 Tax=Trifolium subterraneum TaxID=3900 RepID=A0A2Z6LU85_TRISU|nr:hypothetical protein TSUD_247050 [Trifolium subterraneum]